MLIVVRHGRTVANASGLLQGRVDHSLDETGRRQAAALAVALDRPALIVSSPLARCRETAAAFGAPVEIDDRWIELDYGEWDGRPVADVPAETWRAWRSDLAFAPPGGEPLGALGERVRAAGADLLDRAADEDVVVVTHVSPIKATVAWALGTGDEVGWRAFVDQASVTRVGVAGDRPVLRGFNDVSHLQPIEDAG